MEREIERPVSDAVADTVSEMQEGVHFHILELDFRFCSGCRGCSGLVIIVRENLFTYISSLAQAEETTTERTPTSSAGEVHRRDGTRHNLARLLCSFR